MMQLKVQSLNQSDCVVRTSRFEDHQQKAVQQLSTLPRHFGQNSARRDHFTALLITGKSLIKASLTYY